MGVYVCAGACVCKRVKKKGVNGPHNEADGLDSPYCVQ